MALLALIPAIALADVRASALLGGELARAGGDKLGGIDDLVFDARDGTLRVVVADGVAFSARGLQAESGKRYALPEGNDARAFTPPAWPAMRASALIGREVIDRERRDFGEIRDLVVDLEAGRVRSALVDRRDDWAAGQALVTVPIEEFSLPRDLADKVALNYSRERFE